MRTAGIVFFGITTALNILGGIGTSCAAFLTERYPSLIALVEQNLQWLYQALVITTTILGITGIWATINLTRGKKNAYRNAFIVLVIGAILAGIQYYYSLLLFGKAAPANMKFYANALALILFMIFLIPGIRERVNFSWDEKDTESTTAGGLAAIIIGVLLLKIPVWAATSHTYQGENWVNLLQVPLNISGILLTGGGLAVFGRVLVGFISREHALAVNSKTDTDT